MIEQKYIDDLTNAFTTKNGMQLLINKYSITDDIKFELTCKLCELYRSLIHFFIHNIDKFKVFNKHEHFSAMFICELIDAYIVSGNRIVIIQYDKLMIYDLKTFNHITNVKDDFAEEMNVYYFMNGQLFFYNENKTYLLNDQNKIVRFHKYIDIYEISDGLYGTRNDNGTFSLLDSNFELFIDEEYSVIRTISSKFDIHLVRKENNFFKLIRVIGNKINIFYTERLNGRVVNYICENHIVLSDPSTENGLFTIFQIENVFKETPYIIKYDDVEDYEYLPAVNCMKIKRDGKYYVPSLDTRSYDYMQYFPGESDLDLGELVAMNHGSDPIKINLIF